MAADALRGSLAGHDTLRPTAEGATCATGGHCWHSTRGALFMVLRDGYVPETCCRCQASRQIHADHAPSSVGRARFGFTQSVTLKASAIQGGR